MHTLSDCYRHRNTWSLLIIAAFLTLLSLCAVRGQATRVISTTPVSQAIDAPEQAYALWESRGVRGRVLLLFDDYPHMRGLAFYDGAPRLSRANVIEYAILHNIIRRVYLVVPDEEWRTFSSRKDIGIFRSIGDGGTVLCLFTMSGVPMFALPASFLSEINEPLLVYVNSERFPIDRVRTLLDRGGLRSDITTVYRGDRQ